MLNDFAPLHIKFGNTRKLCLQINIEGDDYELCEIISRNQWNNEKVGKYGKGLANREGDPCRVERIGLLGEMAVSILFDLGVDVEYKEYGKKNDFTLKGYTVDVKTSHKLKGGRQTSYIYAGKDEGEILSNPIKSDLYICCTLEWEKRKEGRASLLIIGWEYKKVIRESERLRTPLSSKTHYNYELPFKSLRNISDLYILMCFEEDK